MLKIHDSVFCVTPQVILTYDHLLELLHHLSPLTHRINLNPLGVAKTPILLSYYRLYVEGTQQVEVLIITRRLIYFLRRRW